MAQAPTTPATMTVDGEERPMPASLWAAMPKAPAAARYLVPRLLILDRLTTAGKLRAALNALKLDAPVLTMTDADLRLRERWLAATAIYSDDPEAIALIRGVGADPAVILAPE